MPPKRKLTSKRELIEPKKGDKRYVRREAGGTFGKVRHYFFVPQC